MQIITDIVKLSLSSKMLLRTPHGSGFYSQSVLSNFHPAAASTLKRARGRALEKERKNTRALLSTALQHIRSPSVSRFPFRKTDPVRFFRDGSLLRASVTISERHARTSVRIQRWPDLTLCTSTMGGGHFLAVSTVSPSQLRRLRIPNHLRCECQKHSKNEHLSLRFRWCATL